MAESSTGQRICYYELLQVDMTASSDDIKKQYRKLALKFHPDKNKEDDAQEKFRQINEAYECLKDPNERSWYDQHRQQILSGKDKLDAEEIEQESFGGINIQKFFNTNCFQGDPDSPTGFNTVYRELFENIKAQEEKHYQMNFDGENSNREFIKLPGFGDSNTIPEKVHEFYQMWRCFESYKTFYWADKYREQDEERYVRRQIEKENKKERNSEKKKYIKTIKELVEFVFNNDSRYSAYEEFLKEEKHRKYLEKKQEKEKKEQDLKILQQKQKAEFEAQQKIIREQELEKIRLKEEQERKEKEEAAKKLKEQAQFQCEYCDKIFETANQQFNHVKSKQHIQQIEKLKKQGKIQAKDSGEGGTWLDKINQKKKLEEQQQKEALEKEKQLKAQAKIEKRLQQEY